MPHNPLHTQGPSPSTAGPGQQPPVPAPGESISTITPPPGTTTPSPFISAGISPDVMTGEERKADLDSMMSQVENKFRQVNSRGIMDDNNLRVMKSQIIRAFFDIMQEHGVDPNDLNSINQFLGVLQRQDPDLFQLFEMAFNGLLGEEQQPPPGEAPATTEPGVAPELSQRFNNIRDRVTRAQQ